MQGQFELQICAERLRILCRADGLMELHPLRLGSTADGRAVRALSISGR